MDFSKTSEKDLAEAVLESIENPRTCEKINVDGAIKAAEFINPLLS